MPNLGPMEILAILAIVVLLFGAKKLPDLARGSGQALRIFKDEVKSDGSEDAKPEALEPKRLDSEASTEQKKPEQQG